MSAIDVPPRLLAPHEAATFLGLSASTLSKLRVFGGGPKYIKLGRRVVYDRDALDAWLSERTYGSTSEYVARRREVTR